MSNGRIALVGLGTIGRGWAVLYAQAGFEVAVYEPDPQSFERAISEIAVVMRDMATTRSDGNMVDHLARITRHQTLPEAVAPSIAIHESVPENLELKRTVLRQIEAACLPESLILSSCSSLAPDAIFEGFDRKSQALVAHPFNPPYLLPLVELVAGSETSPSAIDAARSLMARIGQVPIVLRRFISGYLANRLQAAVVNEAMHLVDLEIASPGDIDLCMTHALGPRWAVMGPFETMDYNADGGVADYAAKFGDSYAELGKSLMVDTPWSPRAVDAVVADRRAAVPIDLLAARRRWRDQLLLEARQRSLSTSAVPCAISEQAS